MSLGDFVLGAASSLFASVLILVLTHLDDVRYLFTSSRKYRHLEGDWYQYHLTTDSRHDPPTFWSTHAEVIEINSLGRVRGHSQGGHRITFDYRVSGTVRQNVMQLRLKNQNADELSASFTYPKLWAGDVLVGVWVGQDYDEDICAGPAVLSRSKRSAEELANLVRNERLLAVGRRTSLPILERE